MEIVPDPLRLIHGDSYGEIIGDPLPGDPDETEPNRDCVFSTHVRHKSWIDRIRSVLAGLDCSPFPLFFYFRLRFKIPLTF